MDSNRDDTIHQPVEQNQSEYLTEQPPFFRLPDKSISSNGKIYTPAGIIAKEFGYSWGHISLLARDSKIDAICLNKRWYIYKPSVVQYRETAKNNQIASGLRRQGKVLFPILSASQKQNRGSSISQPNQNLGEIGTPVLSSSSSEEHLSNRANLPRSSSSTMVRGLLKTVASFLCAGGLLFSFLIYEDVFKFKFGYHSGTVSVGVNFDKNYFPKQYSSIKQSVSADILSPVRNFVSKYLLPEYGYETYLVVDPYRRIESRITNLESKLFITSPPQQQPGTIVIREIVPAGTDVSAILALEQRINTVSVLLSNLSDNFTSFSRITPTTLVLPPTNTTGIGPITSNPDTVSTGTLTVTGGSTLSGLSLSSDLTVDTSVFKVDTVNNRVGINTSSPETSFEVVGTASISTLTVSSTTTLGGISYTWPSSQTSNKFLMTDGSGTLSWATAGVSSNSLDFDEIVNSMTLDSNLTINRGSGYFIGLGSAPSTVFEVQGTASASYLLTGNTLQVGGYSSAAYSRFGTSTISGPASNWITQANDILVSGDIYGVGSLAFQGPASLSNALYVGTGGKTGNVGIGTTAPGAKLEVAGQVKITGGTPGSGKVLTSDANGLGSWGTLTGDGMLSAVRVYTANDTWSKPTNLDSVVVWVVGGGGGSGGVATTAGGEQAVAAGGGGGGSSVERIASASLGVTETVTVGAAGTGASAGNNTGGTGGTSSFGAHVSATGGVGGAGGAAGASPRSSGSGGAGGVGSSGDLNIAGGGGGVGIGASSVRGGAGGSSILGGGSQGGDGDGVAGGVYGGGAGGPASGASTTQRAGAAGAAGVVIVYEYTKKAASATGSDLAEWVSAASDVKMQDIVSIDPNGDEKVIKSSKPYDSAVAGIISTDPGLLIGKNNLSSKPLALAGRVPVKVSIKNGEIKRGDAITTSDIPGVGMKATRPGAIVGKAMQALTDQEATMVCSEFDTPSDPKCGLIVVLVNVSWYDPRFTLLTTNDDDIQIGGTFDNLDTSNIVLDIQSKIASLSLQIEEIENKANMIQGNTINSSLIFNAVITMFKDAFNIVFEDGLVRVGRGIFEELTAQKATVERLCVGSVCVTESEFMKVFGTEEPSPTPTPEPTPETGSEEQVVNSTEELSINSEQSSDTESSTPDSPTELNDSEQIGTTSEEAALSESTPVSEPTPEPTI